MIELQYNCYSLNSRPLETKPEKSASAPSTSEEDTNLSSARASLSSSRVVRLTEAAAVGPRKVKLQWEVSEPKQGRKDRFFFRRTKKEAEIMGDR